MKNKNPESTRESKTFFHLIMPMILLVIISFISTCSFSFGNNVILIVVKLLLVLWQYVALKNFIESSI